MNSIYEEIRVALHNVWRRRWLVLAVAWTIALIGWLVVSAIPNRYESKASVFVQMQSLLPDKLGITPAERDKNIDGIQRTLLASDNLEKVVRATELGRQLTTPREIADAAAALRKNIKIVAAQDNLFEISASSGSGGYSNAQNAKLAQDIVQKLLDLFVEGNLAGGRVETSQTLRFLDSQLAMREQQLREAEAKRVAFEQKYLGMLPGPGGSMSQRVDTVRSELNQVESNLMAAQASLAALNGQLASTPQSIAGGGGNNGGGGAAMRAGQLEGQLSEAQSRGWTEDHPDMIALRSQLARARAAAMAEQMMGRNGGGTPNPMYVTLRSMQAEKQATAAALGSRRAQLQAELVTIAGAQAEGPGAEAEQARLNRDYEVLKTQYDKLLADREDVKLRGSVQSETDSIQFRVIEPPSPPKSPVAPNRPLLLTVVLVAALAAGAGAGFAMSQIRTTYASAGSLERAIGLPVIGSVSQILTLVQRDEAKLKQRYFIGGAGALLCAFVLLLIVEFVQRGMVA